MQNNNVQLIRHFYTCFENKDYRGMQACYADKAVFNDAVFKNLNAAQVKAMWEMLLGNAVNFRVEFANIKSPDNTAQAEWTAYYTFSGTGNKVINRIKAGFVIEDGKIVRHTDTFSFYKWARQALGIKGLLLGWTPLVRKKVQRTAMQNLQRFMAKS